MFTEKAGGARVDAVHLHPFIIIRPLPDAALSAIVYASRLFFILGRIFTRDKQKSTQQRAHCFCAGYKFRVQRRCLFCLKCVACIVECKIAVGSGARSGDNGAAPR
jgi:hypothetical protein